MDELFNQHYEQITEIVSEYVYFNYHKVVLLMEKEELHQTILIKIWQLFRRSDFEVDIKRIRNLIYHTANWVVYNSIFMHHFNNRDGKYFKLYSFEDFRKEGEHFHEGTSDVPTPLVQLIKEEEISKFNEIMAPIGLTQKEKVALEKYLLGESTTYNKQIDNAICRIKTKVRKFYDIDVKEKKKVDKNEKRRDVYRKTKYRMDVIKQW